MVQTATQISREAPFLEDYRRRLLDSVYGGTEVYKEGDTLPEGKKIGDKKEFDNYSLEFKNLSLKEKKNYKAIIGEFKIRNSQKEFEKSVSDSNGGIVFLEAALLIEANWYKVCGHIWVVSLDPTVALRRLKERDNLSETEAKLRVEAQLDQEERLAYADVVLQNEGTPEELFTQTQQTLRALKQSMNISHS